MEWMSPMDASFLHIEGPNNPMHIGGVSIFEGPAPPFDRLQEMVEGKLDAVPRSRQKVRFVPLSIARPVWVNDPHFNLSYHVRHTALPAHGRDEILRPPPRDCSPSVWTGVSRCGRSGWSRASATSAGRCCR